MKKKKKIVESRDVILLNKKYSDLFLTNRNKSKSKAAPHIVHTDSPVFADTKADENPFS